VAHINEIYGFDKPLVQQYLTWAGQLLHGNFGTSTKTGRPVMDEFLHRFPATIELTVLALIIAIGVAIPLGYVAARRQGRPLDHFTSSRRSSA